MLLPFMCKARALVLATTCVSSVLRPTSAQAQNVAFPGEFRVNTATDNIQQSATVAMTPSGDFVVAWQSEIAGSGDDIRARRFDGRGVARGEEFPINVVTRGNQDAPSLAMDSKGAFVVVWQSLVVNHYVIRARCFDAHGAALGSEIEVDTRPREGHNAPVVAMSPDGRFVVAWESPIQGSYEIRARRFDSHGVALDGEFLVNIVTQSSQRSPAVAMDRHGNFVVVWRSNVAGSYEIRARRFLASGIAASDEIAVNAAISGDQLAPSVAMDPEGNFVVAWESSVGSELEIRARRFSARGVAQGDEFAVNKATAGNQLSPVVALNEAGNFVIVWHSQAQASSNIYGRAFAWSGKPLGSELALNTFTTGAQKSAAVALDAAGDLVVAWHTYAGGSWDIVARSSRIQLKPVTSSRRAAATRAPSNTASVAHSK